MNWVLTRRPRSRRARDKTFSLAPAWSFEIRSDAVTQPNLSEPATRRSIETIQALSAQVPDAGGELQPQKMKQGEDDFGVASGVRRVLEDRKIGLVIEDLVEDIGRVTNRRRDDLRPVLRVLVRGPGVESEAPSEAEIFRERGRVLRRASNGESLAIGGGEGSTAPGLGKRQLVLWKSTRAEKAALSVSSRRYQSVVHASWR